MEIVSQENGIQEKNGIQESSRIPVLRLILRVKKVGFKIFLDIKNKHDSKKMEFHHGVAQHTSARRSTHATTDKASACSNKRMDLVYGKPSGTAVQFSREGVEILIHGRRLAVGWAC